MIFTIRRNNFVRFTVPFLCGAVAFLLFSQANQIFGMESFLFSVLVEVAMFALACVGACAFSQGQLFRAAGLGIAGVFVAVVAEIIIHPTTQGGYERNLFPLEIAFHLLVAVPSFLLIALVWRVCFDRSEKMLIKQTPDGTA